jgi:hypothetical protein
MVRPRLPSRLRPGRKKKLQTTNRAHRREPAKGAAPNVIPPNCHTSKHSKRTSTIYRGAGHPLLPLLRSKKPPESERCGAGELQATLDSRDREDERETDLTIWCHTIKLDFYTTIRRAAGQPPGKHQLPRSWPVSRNRAVSYSTSMLP